MTDTMLTAEEGALVADLMRLYADSWEAGRCRRNCDCAKCESLDRAGAHGKTVFESLFLKAEATLLARKESKE